MEDNLEFTVEFRVRLPSKLAERIATVAKEELRSRNSQYVYMLENWFDLKAKIDSLVETSIDSVATQKK